MRLLSPEALTPADVEAWSALAAQAAEPNPFAEPGFALAAIRALSPRGVALLVLTGDDGAWDVCVPVLRRGVGRAAVAATWMHPYCFLGTPLVAGDRLEAAGQLAASLGDGFLLARLDGLRADGAVARAMLARASRGVSPRPGHERAVLRLESPEPTASGKSRSELRRRRRKLGEALGGEVELTDRSADPAAWREFLRIEASGWKGQEGTALRSDAAHADFFLEICSTFAAAGRLRLLALGTPERTAAMSVALIAGDTLFGFKSGFDASLQKLGPGSLLMHAVVTDFRARGTERLFDSCADPGSELMNRLLPDRSPIASVVVQGSGRLAAAGGWAARRLRPVRGRLGRLLHA